MTEVAPKLASLRMRLDETEKRLRPGEGKIDLFGFLTGTEDFGQAGFGAEYKHRIKKDWTAYGRGSIGKTWGTASDLAYELTGGLRWRF